MKHERFRFARFMAPEEYGDHVTIYWTMDTRKLMFWYHTSKPNTGEAILAESDTLSSKFAKRDDPNFVEGSGFFPRLGGSHVI